MHINFKEPHITKSIYTKTQISNKIQLAFQITKSFILEVYGNIFYINLKELSILTREF